MQRTTVTLITCFLLPGLCCLLSLPAARSQSLIDSLEARLDESYGKEKLVILNELITLYLDADDPRQALRYGHRAEVLAENIVDPENQLLSESDLELKPLTYLLLGQAYRERGQFLESKMALEKAETAARAFELTELEKEALLYLAEIDSISAGGGKQKRNFLGRAFRDVTSTIEKTTDDFGVKASLKLARMHENKGNYPKALEQYSLAINQSRDLGDWRQVEEIRKQMAELQERMGDYPGAVSTFSELKKEKESRSDFTGAASLQSRIDSVSRRARETARAWEESVEQQLNALTPEEKEIAEAEHKVRDIRSIAEKAERTQDFEKSLNYYKQYLAMEQQLAEQKRLQELALLENAHEIENQEREITLLRQNEEINQLQLLQNQAELQRQLTTKRSLAGGLVLSGGLVFTLFLLYRFKRREHKNLDLAYRELETAQGQLQSAQERIRELLHQQVSGAVANELLAAGENRQVQRRFVCIMFLDIRDFTPFVEQLSPEDIIEYQNEVLGFMIETVTRRNGIVNQILGDGFMATFGAPVSAGNDCREAYLAAREIMDAVREKAERGEIPPTRIGIGLHAGHVVAGNVGTRDRRQYSITGNPVITAARLEQLNKKFGSTLVISREVYDHLPEDLQEPMHFREVKVRGRKQPVEIAAI